LKLKENLEKSNELEKLNEELREKSIFLEDGLKVLNIKYSKEVEEKKYDSKI